MLLAARPSLGVALALLGIAAAASLPPYRLLTPSLSPAGITSLADGSIVAIEGEVVAVPEHLFGWRTRLAVAVKRAGESGDRLAPSSGTVSVTAVGRDENFREGDEVFVRARLFFPHDFGNPGEFDYRAYLERHGVVATMFVPARPYARLTIRIIGYHPHFPSSEFETIRNRIGAFIDTNLHGTERAIMRALVIGDRGGIGERLRSRFALTGMAHLLVISGLHLGFVAAAVFVMVRLLLGFFPALMARGWANKIAAFAAAVAVTAYASIAGHHVSTDRALVMVLAYTIAIMLDRSREVLASLALAALVICLVLPGSTADISFQLSFASVLVIILGMRRFTGWWRTRYRAAEPPSRLARAGLIAAEVLMGYFAVSFWALLATAPLTAYYFNQFSLVGLVANAVVVPIVGFGATVLGLVAAALSFVSIPVAGAILRLAGAMAWAGWWLAGWFLRWPFAWVRVFTPTVLEIALAYGFVMLWLIRPVTSVRPKRIEHDARARGNHEDAAGAPAWSPRLRPLCLGALLLVLAVDGGWWTWRRYFDPDLRVTFLSVGEGDAAVIRFPGARVMLIDAGGGFHGSFDPGERIVAPYLWSHKIMHVDYLVLSHPDRDHFGGFDFIVHNFHPDEFWSTGSSSSDVTYAQLMVALEAAHVRMKKIDESTAPMRIGGVDVKCLGPPRNLPRMQNNTSMVLRFAFGPAVLLFTGDLEAKGERDVLSDESRAELASTVLKVPHHGSRTSSTEAFVEAVHPEAAVISLGYHNRFHFPAQSVLERYRAVGARVLRTDQAGAVSVDVSAHSVRMWTWRRPAETTSAAETDPPPRGI